MSEQNRTILRRIPLFRDFDDAACDALTGVLKVRHFEPGDAVFRQGERGDTMVVVASGHLRVELDDGKAAPTTIGAITAGEIVGEMAVLDPAPRASSVVAVSETMVFELSRAGLQQLRVSSPASSAVIVSAVISDVTRRLRQINTRIDKLLNPSQSGGFRVQTTIQPLKTGEIQAEQSLMSRIWSRLTGD